MINTLRKSLLLIILLGFSIISLNAQDAEASRKGFYGGLAFGPSFKAGTTKLTSSGTLKGSYGEGFQSQLRVGNYFTDKFAVELGVGYLHGKAQQVVEDQLLNVKGSARAFGAALTGVYHVYGGFYAKAGLLTKIGGKTAIEGKITAQVPAVALNPAAPAGINSDILLEIERDNTGKFPLGFIGGLGYKYHFDNISVFAEVLYEGIKVPGNKSKLASYKGTVTTAGQAQEITAAQITAALGGLAAAGLVPADRVTALGGLVADEVTYGKNGVDDFDSPYSSIGLMIGVSYGF